MLYNKFLLINEIISIESGCSKLKIRKHHKGSPIRRVRFDADGRMLTIAKTVKIHDLESNETLMTLKRNDDLKSTFYSLTPFGNNVICAGDDDGSVFVWDHRAQQQPIFSSSNCEQYVSDIDGRYEAKKLIVCTSGEGTLTAYDLRNMKMVDPQSELFETGFQCVKWTGNKIVIGGEDGAIYVFNQNEWAHTSGKFAISDDPQNRGKCSIDAIDVLPGGSVFLSASSDGKIRSFTLWPHKILGEKYLCKKRSLESIHVNKNEENPQIVVAGDEYLSIVNYTEKEGQNDVELGSSSESELSTDSIDKGDSENGDQKGVDDDDKMECENESNRDYLNVFR